MTNSEKSLSERMADLEDKIDYLIYADKPKYEPSLSEVEFKDFYSRIEKYFSKLGVLGGRLTMNTRFENVLKHKVLYPDYEYGCWYPIGETNKAVPIEFRDMRYDFCIEMIDAGNFPPKDNLTQEVL